MPAVPFLRGGHPRLGATTRARVAFDDQARHTAMLDGYQPGDPVVRVFACQASPGRPAEEIAEEAFAIYAGPDFVRARVITHGDHKMAGGVH